jgi:branched-chain amino acid transport system permease protein
MLTFVAILVDGLIYSSWLFVVAVGLTLIFGVMKILNVAHGSLYAFGAYASASLIGAYFNAGWAPLGSFAVILLAALIIGVALGLLMERGLLRFMYGRDEVIIVLVTYAVFLILEDVIILIWGTSPYFAYQPYSLLGTASFGVLTFSNYDLALIGLSVFIGGLLWWGLTATRQGKMLQAVIHDREMALAFGIDVTRMFTITFVIGAVLGALGGAVTAPQISVTPGIGVEVIVIAFAVVVVGGMGSIPGAAVGALIVGMIRATAVHLIPQVELFVIYAVMSLVLAFRPKGLFSRAEARKI